MILKNPNAEIFIPDAAPLPDALSRTTHLGIGAHPDDLEFMAYGGILECFQNSSVSFSGIVLTDGGGSPRSGRFAGLSDSEIAAIRREEQKNAARIGKYGVVVQLGYTSAEIKDSANAAPASDLDSILRACAPRTVYIHNPADKHPTHIAAFALCLRVLRSLPVELRPSKVIGCEVWRGLDWLPDSEKIRMSTAGNDELENALNTSFESQISGGKEYALAVRGRRRANATFSDPHTADASSGTIFGIDLTSLVADTSLDPVEFTCAAIRRFENEVRTGLENFLPERQGREF